MSLGNITAFFLFCFTEVSKGEVSLNSIDRYIRDTSHNEVVYDQPQPPKGWPSDGTLEFKNFSMKYSENGPQVLTDINLKIEDQEKVCFVGRTGSGKSSLLKAILRLYDLSNKCESQDKNLKNKKKVQEQLPTDSDQKEEMKTLQSSGGQILLSGVDIKTIGSMYVRQAIGLISQEPVIFEGSLRYNLDPISVHEDQKILEVCKTLGLDKIVDSEAELLDLVVSKESTAISQGQKQLICVGRVMLSNSKFILSDEATSNIDFDTDRIIRRVLTNNFAEKTVLTISHREEGIKESKRVVEIGKGQVISDRINSEE